MHIPETIRSYLNMHGKGYRGILEDHAPLEERIQCVIVEVNGKLLSLIVLQSQSVDLSRVATLLKREVKLVSEERIERVFHDCEPGAVPPIPAAYGIQGIIDPAVLQLQKPVFCSGRNNLWIQTTTAGLVSLLKGATKMAPIATKESPSLREEILGMVEQFESLPPMPGIAHEIIRIKNNHYATVGELVAVIERDPALAAQLVRQANAMSGDGQDPISSIEEAVVETFGFHLATDISLGLTLGRALSMKCEGPLGLNAFWHHALSCAALTQELCNSIPYVLRPDPATAYFIGLLHNVGQLLLGNLFPEHFKRLNSAAAERRPTPPLLELEQEMLGVQHTELGQKLMLSWDMPNEVAIAIAEHHNAGYRGDYSNYANLIYLANALLSRIGIGDGTSEDIPAELLARLDLEPEMVEAALSKVIEGKEMRQIMAEQMAA